MNDFLKEIAAIATFAERAISAWAKWVESTARDAERAHHRAELLAAYRRRLLWKKADVPHLQSLGVSAIAQRRMAQLTGRGRPVVHQHQPLSSSLVRRFAELQPLWNPKASPHQRRRAVELWPWWEHYVEALYRSEFAHAKNRGIARPSLHAEDTVGNALYISAAKVRKICGRIRRKRQRWEGAANFPPMTLNEFNGWMQTGIPPHLDTEEM